MQDIATELNLSVSTISLALRNSPQVSDETRQLVFETAERLGYTKIARPKAADEIKRIAYICPYEARNDFYGAVLGGAEKVCRQQGITLHYSQLEDLNDSILALYKEADGLLLVGSIALKIILELKKLNLPIVLVDNNLPQIGLDRVATENYGSVFQVITRLHERGHRKIAFLRGPEGRPSFLERWQGYRAAAESLSIPPIEIFCPVSDEQCVEEQLTNFLNTHKPGKDITAVVAYNDTGAIAAHHTLQNLGIHIPNEITLVGFDGLEMGGLLRPSLATCRVERELMGKLGIERLLERIKSPEAPTLALVIDTTFVARHSIRSL